MPLTRAHCTHAVAGLEAATDAKVSLHIAAVEAATDILLQHRLLNGQVRARAFWFLRGLFIVLSPCCAG